ncbi:metastasis-associated protein MTA2-like [Pollicipes pollicipes]|uniref:metastasis-associated protein MTA2-like n=1 Tax=Pollicipes pollicipes TaxID=41117 RepID=UPI0018855F30|nr:metastasis-associated protein MTA2-like [Pollicipes pollicipes]
MFVHAADSNTYQAGDYVYCEVSPTDPYQVRRIEELKQNTGSVVEAKMTCLYRRGDIPSSLIASIDTIGLDRGGAKDAGFGGRSSQPRHLVDQRELFPSRQVETLPASCIRGRCFVTLLTASEQAEQYLDREDSFFYTLLYDPVQRTLVADRGEVRLGERHQATVPAVGEPGAATGRDTLIWSPRHRLTDDQLDRFLLLARSVGTFARALDCPGSVCQPSLHLAAAAASRDVTLLHAMDTLHRSGYDLAAALAALVPSGGASLCQDQLEAWSADEAAIFERALGKLGKNFAEIRRDFLPWKSTAELVEYYYLWKTTGRCLLRRRAKVAAAAARARLARVCCWLFWRRYGGLRRRSASAVA